MTSPRPAGRPWTLTDDDMLRKLRASGMNQRLIAQKMKRSIGAIQSRFFLKTPKAVGTQSLICQAPRGRLSRVPPSADRRLSLDMFLPRDNDATSSRSQAPLVMGNR
jgi:hypothetical protein